MRKTNGPRGSNVTAKGTKPEEKRQPRHHRAANADAARFARGNSKKPIRETINAPSQQKKEGRWVLGIHSCREVFKMRPKAIAEIWLRNDFERSEDLNEFAQAARKSSL